MVSSDSAPPCSQSTLARLVPYCSLAAVRVHARAAVRMGNAVRRGLRRATTLGGGGVPGAVAVQLI